MGWHSGAGQGGVGGTGAVAAEDSIGVVARRRFWVRPVASLALPGSGQWLSHQSRAAAYLAAEAYTLVRYLQLMHRGRSAATAFRDLAFQVARGGFAPPPAARDTAFEYFETMERYTASGQFNQSPGPALVPESDTTTYNGAVWRLARRTYWRNPDSPPDNAFRNAQEQLGLLLANHVASAVDALISSRLAGVVRRPAALHTSLGPGGVAVDVSLGF